MQQLLKVWASLDVRKQIIVVVATVSVFLAVLAMSRLATAPTLTLLYAGLEQRAAGDVVRALEQRGVPYEVRGDSIFVPASERDELRLTLASEGLPANSTRGYELLDNLSGFGTTSQMFDAAYWRAKEGELARTIVAGPHVAQARVHIASTGSNPFQRSVTPTASVAVTASGTPLTNDQANAIRFLVASAVAGLSPEDVAVIDANGVVIGSTVDTPASSTDDRSQILRERVERLLEARVGTGNAIVEVSVDTVNETEEIRERRFDPESRVAISTDTEERSSNSNEAGSTDVTVASNLPDGDAGANDTASSQNSETRERINYEVSETQREIVRAAGAIKRITVAVLVNDLQSTAPDGSVTSEARTEEELASLRELVESAVGFDNTRGDIITIKSMELQTIAPVGTEATASFMDNIAIDLMSAIQMAILSIVVLILGLFVIRPLLTKSPNAAPQIASPAQLPANTDEPSQPGEASSDTPAFDSDNAFSEIQINDPPGGFPELPALDMNTDGFAAPSQAEDPVDRLRAMIGERQEETVEILRTWLEESKERA